MLLPLLCRRKEEESLQVCLMKFVYSYKVNIANKRKCTQYWQEFLFVATVPGFRLSQTDPSVRDLSSGALRILFAG